MTAQIRYYKTGVGTNNGYGYQVIIMANGKTEFPFEGRLFQTKREARKATAAAYEGPCWKLNQKRNTIYID